jgi:hypothetical protein
MSAGKWQGQTVICVASGPSLTVEDCELAQESGHRIIAVNSSWVRVPKCDVVYASDHAWWKRYVGDLTIPAERWTNNKLAAQQFGLNHWLNNNGYNSGLSAMNLALRFGAARILLLGYDCKPKAEEVHWHGRHPKGMNNPNQISFRMWRQQFARTVRMFGNRVVNCTRDTALTCYVRQPLEEALQAAPSYDQALSVRA